MGCPLCLRFLNVYLVKWKRQNVGGHVFLPVRVVDVPHPPVVHANDAQVELLDAQNVPQRVHVLPQPGAAQRHHLLEVPQNYPHLKTCKTGKKLLKMSTHER